jgi:SNF2 family DNA or RNA helicase
VRPAVSRIIELTGTPATNGLHDLWSQIYLLDQGKALGETITEFRERWFIPKTMPGTGTPVKWVPRPQAETEIYQQISHLVVSAQNLQLQLEQPIIDDVKVTLPPDILEAYKEFKKDLVMDIVQQITTEDGQQVMDVATVIAQNQAVLLMKLLQFASGTLYTTDPDDPTTNGRYAVVHKCKLDAVMAICRYAGQKGETVLLPYHFRSDHEQLVKRFAAEGIEARTFDGSRAMVQAWNDRQIPVMMLHPASAGHGLNLQFGGHRMIWFTLPFSLEHYMQTNGRLHRPGQQHRVIVHRLLATGTQDERMPAVLSTKEAVQDDLVAAVDIRAAIEQSLVAELGSDIELALMDAQQLQSA